LYPLLLFVFKLINRKTPTGGQYKKITGKDVVKILAKVRNEVNPPPPLPESKYKIS
jgi:hypothetical protein